MTDTPQISEDSTSHGSDEDDGIVDVVIVGAGLSGIGAACHLVRERPGSTYVVFESREDLGGTWDLFRYPGIRSDSDMYTLGYSFRPWRERRAIADGSSILKYLRDTATEYDVSSRIRYGHRVSNASWNTARGCWSITAERTDPDTGESRTVRIRSRWLSVCAGYYRYDRGHRPTFPGEESFSGRIISPQHWPSDLDWTDKRVTVIGSGATAVTLVPTLASTASHVTMLQRTPTYIVSQPGEDAVARILEHLPLPSPLVSRIIFWKNVIGNVLSYETAQKFPKLARRLIRRHIERELGEHVNVDKHFDPPYDPWDQRVCAVPDGDLFSALKDGRAEVITDTIDTFVERGIKTTTGRVIDSDIIVAATGLQMLPIGGIELTVDCHPVDLPNTYVYKGMMLSGVPNFNLVIGYTNNSWTLKADLVSRTVGRLLLHLDRHGFDTVVPRAEDGLGSVPFVDLRSGYVQRAIATFPRQGTRTPWRLHQNYLFDIGLFRRDFASDSALEFRRKQFTTSAPTAIIERRGAINV